MLYMFEIGIIIFSVTDIFITDVRTNLDSLFHSFLFSLDNFTVPTCFINFTKCYSFQLQHSVVSSAKIKITTLSVCISSKRRQKFIVMTSSVYAQGNIENVKEFLSSSQFQRTDVELILTYKYIKNSSPRLLKKLTSIHRNVEGGSIYIDFLETGNSKITVEFLHPLDTA